MLWVDFRQSRGGECGLEGAGAGVNVHDRPKSGLRAGRYALQGPVAMVRVRDFGETTGSPEDGAMRWPGAKARAAATLTKSS